MDAQTAPARSVRLRPEAFTKEALRTYGWKSQAAAAKAVGVAPSTLHRAITGETAPGERLIAALLTGTKRPFEHLFTITE